MNSIVQCTDISEIKFKKFLVGDIKRFAWMASIMQVREPIANMGSIVKF